MYDGEWKNNLRHGYGIEYYPSGKMMYYGELKKDLKHGFGV